MLKHEQTWECTHGLRINQVSNSHLRLTHTEHQASRQASAASETSDLCNGSGTHLERQVKHHHRLALVTLPLTLDARCGYTLWCYNWLIILAMILNRINIIFQSEPMTNKSNHLHYRTFHKMTPSQMFYELLFLGFHDITEYFPFWWIGNPVGHKLRVFL